MKIGIQARFLRKPSTGIGQVTSAFLRELAHSAWAKQHQFVLFVEEQPIFSFDLPKNWEVQILSSWYRRDDLVREHWFESWLIPRAVARTRCDVLLSLSQGATLLPKHFRHVMVVHDLVPLHFPEYLATWRKRWHYRKVQQAIAWSEKVVTISEATSKDLQSLLHVPVSKISVIPLGISESFQTLPDEGALRTHLKKYALEGGNYLYHGGGLEIRKNTAALLRAYARLIPELGDTLPPLVVSGTVHPKENPLATDIFRIIQELKLESRVKVLGFVPEADLPALYAGAIAFLYPSLFEGFGLPLVEAFALQVPVITSKGGATEEIAGQAALLVDPHSEKEIAEGIKKLILDAAYRDHLALLGKKQSEQYSWKRFTSELMNCLVQ